jgi:ubiquinone biosynthesis protein
MTLMRIPELVRRIEERFPAKGGAPEQPPLPDVELMWERRRGKGKLSSVLGYGLAALVGGGAVWAAVAMHWIG